MEVFWKGQLVGGPVVEPGGEGTWKQPGGPRSVCCHRDLVPDNQQKNRWTSGSTRTRTQLTNKKQYRHIVFRILFHFNEHQL